MDWTLLNSIPTTTIWWTMFLFITQVTTKPKMHLTILFGLTDGVFIQIQSMATEIIQAVQLQSLLMASGWKITPVLRNYRVKPMQICVVLAHLLMNSAMYWD